MIELRRVAPSARTLALALLLAACGSNDDSRPIEVLFYVDGLSGTRFAVDGLQAANADHRLPGRTFEAPFFFVLENALQFHAPEAGIRGCFHNSDATASITIFLYYGTTFQQSVVLQPGERGGPGSPCDVAGDVDPAEVRFELCTRIGNTLCMDDDREATGPVNVALTASLGDFDATNITTCSVPEAAVSFCTTPSIFYIEDPQDAVQGIFTKLAGQNPDVDLQADLYIGGALRTSETSDGDVIIDETF